MAVPGAGETPAGWPKASYASTHSVNRLHALLAQLISGGLPRTRRHKAMTG